MCIGFMSYKSQQQFMEVYDGFMKCLWIFAVFGIIIMLLFHGMELIGHLKQLLGYHWKYRNSEKD